MQPTNCCYSSKMHTTNWCCYCKIIPISQMQSANCCCYCKTRWRMHTATAIARWYHKCILQNGCCYCKIISKMLIANCFFSKVLPSLRGVVKVAYWKLIPKFKKYFELQCHLNSTYSLLSARPFDKRTENASEQQYFQFFWYNILILIWKGKHSHKLTFRGVGGLGKGSAKRNVYLLHLKRVSVLMS